MREIEIKVRIRDPKETLAALDKLGIALSEPKKQHDVVYGWPNALENNPAFCWLRIRTENDARHILTLKRNVTTALDSIEHETIVEDAKEMAAIIAQLGYVEYSDITKIRRKGHSGDIEICYDELPELGTYLEAEKLCAEDVDYATVEAELWAFLAKLGIGKDDEETNAYDVLIVRQRAQGDQSGSNILVQADH